MNRLLIQGLAVILTSATNLLAVDPPEASIQFTNYSLASVNELSMTADFDADGRFDLMTLRTMRLHWNSGSNFVGGIPFNYSTDDLFPFPPVAADFDNDSDMDILFVRVSMLNRRTATIHWNRGNRQFTNPPVVLFPHISFGSAAAADYDNDGDLDFVLTGNTNAPNNTIGRNTTRLYENLGAGSFIEVPHSFPSVEDGVVAWADYDGDGDSDLLLTGYTASGGAGTSRLYRNDSGLFVDSEAEFPPLVKDSGLPVAGTWGDCDNDGDLDLLMIGATLRGGGRQPLARVYRNDSTNFHDLPLSLTNANYQVRGTWADLDADGDLDIIAGPGAAGGAVFLPNDGQGTFGPASATTLNSGYFYPAFFNRDTMPDLLLDRFDFRPTALRNVTAATNTAPEIPSGLTVVQSGNSVRFVWNAAQDAEQSAGLSYNVRIGRTPGGSEVMSAMADATNGQRYVAALGNAGLNTNWTIRNFAIGTYYWSVQAIDHGFVGSRFAEEQSFTISNAPPVVEMFRVTNETPNSATLTFRLNANGAEADYYLVFTSTNHSGTNRVNLPVKSGVNVEQLLASGLLPSTQYEVYLVASNEFGVNATSARRFTTRLNSPVTEIVLPFTLLSQNPVRMVAADLDQNGHLDVLLAGLTNGVRTNIVLYNDTGVFGEAKAIPTFASSPGVDSAVDFNNDGLLDLVFANANAAAIRLRRDTNFTQPVFITGASERQVFARDADNDGDVDLLYPSDLSAGALRLGVNTGINQLEYPTLTGLSRVPALEWGDYDNDGDEDFLGFGATNQSFDVRSAVTHIFRNDGAYAWTNVNAGLPGTLYGAAWVDYDNDHDLDVAVILSTNILNQSVEVYRNGGSNGFEKVEINIPTFESLVAVDWVDFNRDSKPDLFLQQDLATGDRLHVFLASGTNLFVEHPLNIPTNVHYETAFADFDGDAMPDILLNTTTNRTQFRPRLFRNNLVSTAARPAPPINLAAVPAKTSVELNWQVITNENNTTPAYSFNLRIGKTPGGSEIMSAMSDAVTGARYLPQRGNAGQSGTWRVRDLPPGTYYWSVQSVDHAFNGSSFSPEVMFEIAAQDRTVRMVAFEPAGGGRYALTVDGPTRSNVQLETSTDLQEWIPGNAFYIGSEPRTITVNNGGDAALFFRFYVIK